MNKETRYEALHYCGELLGGALHNSADEFPGFKEIGYENPWFTPSNLKYCFNYWHKTLQPNNIRNWLDNYNLPENKQDKTLGLVFAGNIPLVGLHDFLSSIACGFKTQIKLSSKDQMLPRWLISSMQKKFPELKDRIVFTNMQLHDFDAVIATGSNNTSRYFEYYFEKHPHIIRKNRHSIAILDGKENDDTLEKLADDIFLYFGLGCRSISKIFIPSDYDISKLSNAFSKYQDLINHHKYVNNYDYHKAVFMMSKIQFEDNGVIMFREENSLHSPLAVLHYERYSNIDKVKQWVKDNHSDLQCVVSNENEPTHIRFGLTQNPRINEYADNIDTIDFLTQVCNDY